MSDNPPKNFLNFARRMMEFLALVPLPSMDTNSSQPHGQSKTKANNCIMSHKPREPHLHHYISDEVNRESIYVFSSLQDVQCETVP